MKSESEVTQSCPTFCDPMDYSQPDSSIHGILQARILEWIAISFSRGSSRPRDRTLVSRIEGRCFNLWAYRMILLLSHQCYCILKMCWKVMDNVFVHRYYFLHCPSKHVFCNVAIIILKYLSLYSTLYW